MCNILEFTVASADIDAQMQESKQGTMMIETVFCGRYYIILLKLGELSYMVDLRRLHYNSVSYWMPRLK